GADHHLPGGGVAVDPVAGGAVGGGLLDAAALALAEGEAGGAAVGAEHRPAGGGDRPGGVPAVARPEPPGAAMRADAGAVTDERGPRPAPWASRASRGASPRWRSRNPRVSRSATKQMS